MMKKFEEKEQILTQYPKIPKKVLKQIRIGYLPVKVVQSKNINDFLEELNFFLSENQFLDKDLFLLKICHQSNQYKVFLYSSEAPSHLDEHKNEYLYMLILMQFQNLQYYAYIIKNQNNQNNFENQKKIERQIQNKVLNHHEKQLIHENQFNDENQTIIEKQLNDQKQVKNFKQKEQYYIKLQIKRWIKQYPQINKRIIRNNSFRVIQLIKDISEISYENDGFSHYLTPDGSESFLISINCDKYKLKEIFLNYSKFNYVFFSQESKQLLFLKLSPNETIQQYFIKSYYMNVQTREKYISSKFEQSKKHLAQFGYNQKGQLSESVQTIQNIKLQQDLLELFECLDKNFDFNKEYLQQEVFVYYNQSYDPYLLEGLIIFPQFSFYENIAYTLSIKIPLNYPKKPPKIIFQQKLFHPNVNQFGQIQLESLQQIYSEDFTIKSILIGLIDIIDSCNEKDIQNYKAYSLRNYDRLEFKKQIQENAIISGCQQLNIQNINYLKLGFQIYNISEYMNQFLISQQQKDKYKLQSIAKLIELYPQLSKIRNKFPSSYDQLKDMSIKYQNHDYSIPGISFHSNYDESQAILLSFFSKKKDILKAINKKENFTSLYFDSNTMQILLKTDKQSKKSFDAIQQLYYNYSIPLCTHICMLFEKQKKHLKNLGISLKKHFRDISTIPNKRLRQDLTEIFDCLDNELDFKEQCFDQHCYAYYTQSDNPFLLEGLIIGPEGTPYEGIVYTLIIRIPEDYPIYPPFVQFNQQILHPNIGQSGIVFLDVLSEKWNPVLTIQKVLLSIVSILSEQNIEDAYNLFAKKLYLENPIEYKQQILNKAITSGCQNFQINYQLFSQPPMQARGKNIQEFEEEYEYSECDEMEEEND